MKRRRTISIALPLVAVCAWVGFAPAQNGDDFRRTYTKYEHQIEMRDGVRLFTSVYVPKDGSKTYPILLRRTPYSVAPYGPDRYPTNLGVQRSRYMKEGYILAYQDVRGRNMSEGEFVNVRPYDPAKESPKEIDETTDTYDTVEWLVKNVPRNNGRVGISGVSYPGFYSTMGAIDAHPAVKAVSPQAPVSKWMAGDDFWHHGAFLLSHAFDFFVRFGQPRSGPSSAPAPTFDHGTPDGYQFYVDLGPLPNANAKYMKGRVAFWNEMMEHGTWGPFWEARDVLPHLKNIKPAMLVVGGWFDTENVYGALHTYQAIERQNPKATNMLVMGPWSHGQWDNNEGAQLGDIAWGSRTSDYYTNRVEVPFFDFHLKGKGQPKLAEATVFETGSNEWRTLEAWPPATVTATDFYFGADGSLSLKAPFGPSAGSREYISDPNTPVPYTAEIVHWYNPGFMVEDQRFASRRPDVLVYQSEPLSEDVRVAGPLTASLFVSTTGSDSDWVVKLIDVFPNDTPDPDPKSRGVKLGGYQMLVRGDVLRGKFRNSLAKPEPFKPGEVTKTAFVLQDVFHRFRKGHRIMVQVQSSWFPMIDRNPQTFVDIYHARPEDFQKTTQRVFSTPGQASKITLPVMTK